MKTITEQEFKREIERDPSWASKLTKPVEITEHCDMGGSNITHLSPMLYFTGKDEYEQCASFYRCKSLKIAEGNYTGFVWFAESSIEEIGDLTCGKDEKGASAHFSDCKSLKIARGTYTGFVSFEKSGIEKIGDLTCGKNGQGNSARFDTCKSLKVAEGHFPGCVRFWNSGIKEIKNLTSGPNSTGIILNVEFCKNLPKIPISFNPKEIEADIALIERLKTDRLREAAKRHIQTEIVEI